LKNALLFYFRYASLLEHYGNKKQLFGVYLFLSDFPLFQGYLDIASISPIINVINKKIVLLGSTIFIKILIQTYSIWHL